MTVWAEPFGRVTLPSPAPESAAVNDIYQVRVNGLLEGQQCTNVWDFICVGATDDVELRLIVVFVNCFITNLLPVLAHSYSLEDVRWQKVSAPIGIEHIYIPTGTLVGQDDGDGEPSYVSAVLSLRSLVGGRSHRGRKYIAGIPESQTTGSLINIEPPNAALWNALLAFAACVVGAFVHPDPAGGSNIFDVGVYSRKLGGSNKFPYVKAGFTALNEIKPVRELGTTRSRKVGRGS